MPSRHDVISIKSPTYSFVELHGWEAHQDTPSLRGTAHYITPISHVPKAHKLSNKCIRSSATPYAGLFTPPIVSFLYNPTHSFKSAPSPVAPSNAHTNAIATVEAPGGLVCV